MHSLARGSPVVLITAFLAGLTSHALRGQEPPSKNNSQPAPTHIPPPKRGYEFPATSFNGATSCAAASCHGGGTSGKLGSEYSTWIENDPHSRAYRVLFNDVSRSITRKLELPRPAHQDDLCLKCHSLNIAQRDRMEVPLQGQIRSPAAANSGVPSSQLFHSGGVSCENCHGGSGRWLTEHFREPFQKARAGEAASQSQINRAKAKEFGFYPTKDLAFRVTLCASCHVGTPQQEVNHDLIAAGHPRLMFEYTSYQHHPKYKPHWTEKAFGADFEVRAWMIGQVAVARAAVDLLRARATRAPDKPWPELSEYSCYACHKNIGPDRQSWQAVTKSDRAPGFMPWGTWTTPVLRALASKQSDAKAIKGLRELRDLMENQPTRTKAIAETCDRVVKQLDGWLDRLEQSAESDSLERPYSSEQIANLLRSLTANALTPDEQFPDGPFFSNLDWDGVTQHYLGMATLYSTIARSNRAPEWETVFANLREDLLFPPGYNSPRDINPMAVLSRFRRLRDLTREIELPP